ncbi:MAG: hypothetical protein COU67_03490 [Candidatus Pacebacteria bacterium CG10_big_fil_rev_8_21_14_0_10_44_54]|nr:MAG: hypothetical protein COU67_03490 [Candidatus Pacebacteria bacterium CG10_big_fil_rev_8_21_14_0_10_44_54]
MPTIAFDIGSTFTRVAVGSEIIFQQPTCIALEKKSRQVVTTGTAAYALLGKTAKNLDLLFPVSAGVVADTSTLLAYLREVLKLQRRVLPSSFSSLVFGRKVLAACNPCCTVAQKARLNSVLQQAGLRATLVVRPESIAKETSCVIDIGGGTTVCSVVTNGSHVQSHCIPWGGIQLTEYVQRHLLETEQFAVGWHEAERLKRALAAVFTSHTLAKYRAHKSVVRGQDMTKRIGKTLVVTREQLSTVIQPQVFELLDGIIVFFSRLPRELASGIIEEGIVLVGGGSLLSGLAEFLQEKLACRVTVAKNPELVCVKGLV